MAKMVGWFRRPAIVDGRRRLLAPQPPPRSRRSPQDRFHLELTLGLVSDELGCEDGEESIC